MALAYASSPNGLFLQLGRVVKHYDLQGADGAALDAELANLLAIFEAMSASDSDYIVDGIAGTYAGWKSQYLSRRRQLVELATKRLQDKDTILDELGLATNDVQRILFELQRAMIADGQTINGSATSIGAVSADASNVGNGTILTTKILDGYSKPGDRYAASVHYAGVDSQLLLNETHALACVGDSYTDGATDGTERFSWNGEVASGDDAFQDEGSGSIGSIPALAHSQANRLTNADFETWASSAPSGWTAIGGDFGTELNQDQTAGNFYHGASTLKITGDGVATELGVSQALGVSQLKGRRLYCFTARLKADATIAAGDLAIMLEGTDYTAGSSEKIEIAAGSLPTSWSLQSFFVLLPSDLPSDLTLAARWSGTPTDTKSIWLDDLSFSPVNYGGGLGLTIVRGSLPFVRGDRFTFAGTNADDALIQRFMRRAYGVQLPYLLDGNETIADSLAS